MGNPDQVHPDNDDSKSTDFITWQAAIDLETSYIKRLGTKAGLEFFHMMYGKTYNHDVAYIVCILAEEVPALFLSAKYSESNLVRPMDVIKVESPLREVYRQSLETFFTAERKRIVAKAAARFGWTEEQVRRGYAE